MSYFKFSRENTFYVSIIFIIFLCSLLFTPVVHAEITLHSDSISFFLGDSIAIDATINSSENTRGFFIVSFDCTKAHFEYFRIPLVIETSSLKSIEVEPLQITKDLFADSSSCSVIAEYRDFTGNVLQKMTVEDITIRNSLPIQLSVYDADILPGEFISGNIAVSKSIGSSPHYIYTVVFNGKSLVSEGTESSHSFTLQANKSIMPGNITLFASVVDEFGNEGDDSVVIRVPLIVSRFENVYTRKTFYANNSDERFGFTPVVYDHMGRKITAGEFLVTILDPLGKEIASSIVPIGERFSIPVTDSFLSGNYSVTTKVGNSSTAESVEVVNPLRPANTAITGLATADSGILTSSIFWLWVCLVMVASLLGLLIYEYHRRRKREASHTHYVAHEDFKVVSHNHSPIVPWYKRFFSWFTDDEKTTSKKKSADDSGFYDEDGYLDLTKDSSVFKKDEFFNNKKE